MPETTNDQDRLKLMENLCDAYPAVMPFIPTTALMSKLIHKATLIKTNEEIQL